MTPANPSPPMDGPLDPSGRKALLPLKGVFSTGGYPMCPHCQHYQDHPNLTSGRNLCEKCNLLYFLHWTPQLYCLTSKTENIHAFLWN